jgi:hypothetical protein
MGRPSEYSEETALRICERLIEGDSLRKICRDEDMPGISTVLRWLDAHEKFRTHYARAREAQADTLADEITDIADTPLVGQVKKTTEDGVEITEEDMLGHRRLQIDARKWIASKLKPRKYGEKLELGSDPDSPLQINIVDPTRRGSNPVTQ